MQGGIILIKPKREPESLDVRMLVARGVDSFCEEFGLGGLQSRKEIFQDIATQARQMAEAIQC